MSDHVVSSSNQPIELRTAIKNFTEEHAAELSEVEAEIVALVNADSGLSYQEIEGRLGAIYADAEARGDQTTMQLATEAYYHAQELNQTNDVLLGVATGATYGMRKAVEERDGLVDAIDRQDSDHPVVGELINLVREDERENVDWEIQDAVEAAAESIEEEIFDNAFNNAFEEIVSILDRQFGMRSDIAYRFAHVVVNEYMGMGNDTIPGGVLLEIGDFIEKKLDAIKPGGARTS